MLQVLAVAIVIQINNLAGAPPPVVRDAVREVTRVYAAIDVRVESIDADAAVRDPAVVHVIVIGDETGALRRARDTVMGATIWTAARTPIVYLFYRRVEAVSAKYASAVSMVFACTLAHELGHVLMPGHTHAPDGLMRASWRREELQRADQGQLQFTREEVARIRSSTDVVSAFRRTVHGPAEATHSGGESDPAVEDQRRNGARHQLEKDHGR